MFDCLGWTRQAHSIENGVRAALREGKTSAGLGSSLGTGETGNWLANRIASKAP
jgi:hypothetical protein